MVFRPVHRPLDHNCLSGILGEKKQFKNVLTSQALYGGPGSESYQSWKPTRLVTAQCFFHYGLAVSGLYSPSLPRYRAECGWWAACPAGPGGSRGETLCPVQVKIEISRFAQESFRHFSQSIQAFLPRCEKLISPPPPLSGSNIFLHTSMFFSSPSIFHQISVHLAWREYFLSTNRERLHLTSSLTKSSRYTVAVP